MKNLLNDSFIEKDIREYNYNNAYKAQEKYSNGFIINSNNELLKNNVNEVFNISRDLIIELRNQLLEKYDKNDVKYVIATEKVIMVDMIKMKIILLLDIEVVQRKEIQ